MTQISLFLGEVHLTVPGLLDQMVAFRTSRQGWYFICFCIFCTKHRNDAQQVLGEFNSWTPCFPLLYWPQLEQKQTNKKEQQQQLYCNVFSQTLAKTPSQFELKYPFLLIFHIRNAGEKSHKTDGINVKPPD